MAPIQLRDYQQRGVNALERLIMSGKRKVLAVAPTGAGKGTMAAHMLAMTARAGGTALFVVHRREILYDMHDRLRAQGITAGIVMGQVKPQREQPVQLASVQTLLHERRRLDVDLMVVDEAHHYAANEWRQVADYVRPWGTVGFTATPQRADGRPLGDMFEYLVDVVSYSELLDRGDIVPCKLLRPECPLGLDLAEEAARAYEQYIPGQRAFVFTRGLSEAAECADSLNKKGVRARVIDTNTPDKEREETMRMMRAGELDVIVNYYTMTEGIDIPDVSAVVLARSIQHEGAYMQMVGRALRAHPGKTHATVLDLNGASFVHGFPLDNRVYSLKSKGIAHEGGDVREHRRARAKGPEEPPDILHLELVEATREQQMRWGRRRIDWDAVGFGERTDADIAAEFGIHRQVVTRIRKEKKLAAVRKYRGFNIDWSKVDLAGQSDAQIARDLGCHTDTVRAARNKLGVKKTITGRGMDTSARIDWDAQPLGHVSDKALAAQLGVSQSTVFMARTKRGIGPFQVQDLGIDWDKVEFGEKSDAALARELGVSKKTVQRQRALRGIGTFNLAGKALMPAEKRAALDWESVDWKDSNRVIALRLGCSRYAVHDERRRRGLPAPERRASHTGKKSDKRTAHIDWTQVDFSQGSDRDVAKTLGVCVETVQKHRTRLGKQSGGKTGRPKKWVSADTEPAAQSKSKRASASSRTKTRTSSGAAPEARRASAR